MSHFNKTQIKDKLVISLFFKRPTPTSQLLELFLAGSIRASFDIKDDDIVSESGEHLENWRHEDNALIVDKVKIQPKKELQQLIGKKMTPEEIRPFMEDEGRVNELIQSIFYKLNKIYAKQKLYGREIKNFELL